MTTSTPTNPTPHPTNRADSLNPRPVFLWSKLSSEKWEDAWQERLKGVGLSGPVISAFPNRTTIRVEAYFATEPEANTARAQFGGTVRTIKPTDWNKTPRRNTPLRIRQSLIIVDTETDTDLSTARLTYAPRPVISIPSEMAFGTGDHPTTATCLRFLADAAKLKKIHNQPWDMLDIGCGTGILALAARSLGATHALGFDFDPAAVRIAKHNSSRNHTSNVTFEEADALSWDAPRQWPIVAANLFSTILIAAFPRIKAACESSATLILSGILSTQANAVINTGATLGFTFPTIATRGKWVTALAIAPKA